jgi:hypothetical protein
MKIKMSMALLRSPTAVDGQSRTFDLGGSFRTQEYRERANLLGPGIEYLHC